jgi:hypothetical protein
MCNTSFETKEKFFAHSHIAQKRVGDAFNQSVEKNGELLKRLAKTDLSGIQPDDKIFTFAEPFVIKEEVIQLSLHDAAEQALWDLRQWVKDHPKPCECFTCCDTIPDLERALNPPAQFHGVCC